MVLIHILIVVAALFSSYQHWRLYRATGLQPIFMLVCGVATSASVIVVAKDEPSAAYVLGCTAVLHFAKATARST
ncbi:MAG: hypothetical protein ING75_05625 [Rhodocyclaceae bacterium]|nr:hypothetical protein [Rhodocyclaceae bacterium]